MDPGNGFFEQDQSYLNAVFEDLVGPNGSGNQIVDVEASSVTVANNSQEYVFTIRPDVYFSNGDNLTAYTLWFTYVRELVMNAPTAIGYSNFNLITMNAGSDWYTSSCGNFEPWGLTASVGSVMSVALTAKNCKTFATDINNMLSNFNPTNAQQQSIMAYAHQAYSAPNATTFIIRTMAPYGLL
jgi:ABC-type transport system substrate-binding protein